MKTFIVRHTDILALEKKLQETFFAVFDMQQAEHDTERRQKFADLLSNFPTVLTSDGDPGWDLPAKEARRVVTHPSSQNALFGLPVEQLV